MDAQHGDGTRTGQPPGDDRVDRVDRDDRVDRVDVVVVGGGLGGLTAAVAAANDGASVMVVDAHALGGRARTTTLEGGAIVNGGPRALYLGGAAAQVLDELSIAIDGVTPRRRGYRLVRNGRLHTFPSDAGRLLRTGAVSTRAKLQLGALLATVPRLQPASFAGSTVGEWIRTRGLSPDAAATLRAVVRLCTYVDDDELAADAAIAQLQLVLGAGVSYLHGGWQQLVDALVVRAGALGVDLVDHTPVGSVAPDPDGGWAVATGGRSVRASSVVLAAGGPDAVAALSPVPIDRGGLGAPVTAACLDLVVRTPPRVTLALGVDAPLYLSLHGPPARLGPQFAVVHVLRYGTRDHRRDRADLWAHAALAGIDRSEVVAHRFLARMVVAGGIPTGAGGGLAGRPPVTQADGLFLAGDWVGETGLIGDAAMHSGATAGRLAAARSAAHPRSVPRSGGISAETAGQNGW